MKLLRNVGIVLGLLLAPALLHAQSGCIDSPENPTALLGLAGAAGAAWTILRSRRRR